MVTPNSPERCRTCGGLDPSWAEGTRDGCSICRRFRNIANPSVRANKRTPRSLITLAQFARWAESTPLACYSCGIPERLVPHLAIRTQGGHILRHLGLDRLDNDGDYTLANIGCCCLACNQAKTQNFTPAEMRAYIGPSIAAIWRQRLRAAGVDDPWVRAG